MATLLLHLTGIKELPWAEKFRALLPGHRVVLRGDAYDPAEIDYIYVWKPQPDAFDGLTNLKAVLSLGAGVDALMQHPALPDRPLVRFVDADLTQRMSDYVLAHVLMHHRQLTRFAADQRAHRWTQFYPPAAQETTVGIMGMGVLGQDAALKLAPLGFDLRSWSRTPKAVPGIEGFAGDEQFAAFLAGTDILVNLLPLTPETQGILNYANFSRLRRRLEGGPVVINAARGGHQKEADLIRALTDGTLGAASLDVFEVEPLPATSGLWDLPNCYITPHIAAISNPDAGTRYFSQIILDHEAGKPLINLVDPALGY